MVPLLVVFLVLLAMVRGDDDQLLPSTLRSNDFAVLPQHSLLFCRIHKAGSSAITDLVSSIAPPPYPHHSSWTYHQPSDNGFSPADLTSILEDPSWLKVVIYREPLARFLSAYRSKCEDFDADQVCSAVFHDRSPSFAGAIRQMMLREDFTPDGHFHPQAEICNLRSTLPYFSNAFALDRSKSYATITRILDKAHVEITETVNKTIVKHFSPGQERSSPHITHSDETATLLGYYSHDCFIRLVVHHYQEDYSVFRLPCPEWAVGALERTSLDECMEFIQSHGVE